MIPACPGPDRTTKKPFFVPPRGSWDCHAHIFGPSDVYPFSAARSYTPEDCTIDDYLGLLSVLRFDRGVLVQGGAHGTDNRAMLDGLGRAPDRLRGVAVIAPGTSNDDLVQMHGAGVRGVRLSTVVGGGVQFDQLEALAKEIAPFDWHLLLHFGSSNELVGLAEILERIDRPFVLDHLARITGDEGATSLAFGTVLRLLDTDRCYVKLASLYRLSSLAYPHEDMIPMVHEIVEKAPHRIIWGSNWPHPIHYGEMPNDGDLVDLIPLWVPDETTRHKMLVDNPGELYF